MISEPERANEQDSQRADPGDKMIDKSTIRVMVLDDDTMMLKLLSLMLTKHGFTQVVTCNNGYQALDLIDGNNNSPNLILCDLNMPEMDGVEFMRKLVEHRYDGSLILVSGEHERVLQSAEKLVQAHRIRVLGYLNKPISTHQLTALLDKWEPSSQERLNPARKAYSADELSAAITNGELLNYYQPKILVSTGQIVGVETLVRWRHPQDGIVFPDQFIGIAEEQGLIDELTRAVLTAALRQAKAWQNAGLALKVAINVSMDNLVSLDFPDFVAEQAAAAAVAPQDIVLEVTESRLMKDLRAPLESLMRLHLKGFRLSIDDFGTGHSSLTQLRDIPFDELKIDKGFVHRGQTDKTIRAMYEASLGLARQLGMDVVAEGVENQDDWDLLQQTGCDFAQGYLIAKPMPAADIAGWMEDWQVKSRHNLATN
jgi:EAL domain-containing protein (putative c-di-GMP-specific phosphodiesterase class I)/ActR/RegA family two-component response regulator